MLFQTPDFLFFFATLLFLLTLFKRHSFRKKVLLLSSYVFYMWWNPFFILLILYSTAIDYYVGNKMSKSQSNSTRRGLLLISLIANIGILLAFKYGNFFQENFLLIMRLTGFEPSWNAVNILLPVGISFYTFQSMSYTIDVYNRKITPCRSPIDFALFVSFFPQLVAGPIVRASEFLPQLEPPFRIQFHKKHFFLFTRGLAKKVIIADNLGTYVQLIYSSPENFGSVAVFLGALAFCIQIYCDFSGYSDMAIAVAGILGYHLPENFKWPFMASTMKEFWRRWHISLSTWFRDYLYFPLGGNRGSVSKIWRNLFITVTISGVWHGGSWNFVCWGIFHGIYMILENIILHFVSKYHPGTVHKMFGWGITFFWVVITFVIFRAEDMATAGLMLQKIFFFDFSWPHSRRGLGAHLPFAVALMLSFVILHYLSYRTSGIDKKLDSQPLWITTPMCVLMGVVLFILWPSDELPFIYFQF